MTRIRKNFKKIVFILIISLLGIWVCQFSDTQDFYKKIFNDERISKKNTNSLKVQSWIN